MKPVSMEQICQWTMGELIKRGTTDRVDSVIIDSRKAKTGSLFVPLAGENHDGHLFIADAAKNGCSVALTNKASLIPDELTDQISIIRVNDCLTSLQHIAKGYRELFSMPIIAITGSNGKTTTKDMVAGVLGVKYNVLKSKGNYNNHIGLPLTLLELDDTHECLVLEMGMSGLGEIGLLSSIAQPDIAFITNLGWAHIEKLGSKERIAQAKIEIVTGLKNGSSLVINGDDGLLCKKTAKLRSEYKLVKIGTHAGNDLRAVEVTNHSCERFSFKTDDGEGTVFSVNHPGKHHITSALFAVWAGKHFNLKEEEIQKGLLLFEPSGMRMEGISLNGRHFINDAYNANPDSMKAAIELLKDFSTKRKIAVLGDMLELGNYAEMCHRNVADYIIDAGVDEIVLVGDLSWYVGDELKVKGYDAKRIMNVQNVEQAAKLLKKITTQGDTILVKGSRSVGMERIIHLYMEGEN